MGSKATCARKKALKCLSSVRRRNAFAGEVIGKAIDGSSMEPSDKAFATLLVLGVVSSYGALDSIIDRFLDKPSSLQPELRDALRLSTYEIVYLGKSVHAAVDQGVELARSVQPRAAGLANAVLRKIASAKGDFPFGDPASDKKAFALLHAFPEWLVDLLVRELGPERAHGFVKASNLPAPTYVAISSLSNSFEKTRAAIKGMDPKAAPVEVEGIPIVGCFRLSDSKAVSSPEFKEMIERGEIIVSDASAQLIAQLTCDAVEKACGGKGRKPESCLELCAGRGTKTILLQNDIARIQGAQFSEFIAVDNVAFKSKLLEERAQQYGAHVTKSLCADIRDLSKAVDDRKFDLVFLDSPCTGLGTLRRHPEIRWRITSGLIAEDAANDIEFLKSASKHVEDGGVLAYSTCTVTREENEAAVKAFLESEEGSQFGLMPVAGKPVLRTYLADDGYDAHFAAYFVREKVR